MLGLLKRGERLLAHRHPEAGGHTRPLSHGLGVLLPTLPACFSQHVWQLGQSYGQRNASGGKHG
jgi:hypothetical protein